MENHSFVYCSLPVGALVLRQKKELFCNQCLWVLVPLPRHSSFGWDLWAAVCFWKKYMCTSSEVPYTHKDTHGRTCHDREACQHCVCFISAAVYTQTINVLFQVHILSAPTENHSCWGIRFGGLPSPSHQKERTHFGRFSSFCIKAVWGRARVWQLTSIL